VDRAKVREAQKTRIRAAEDDVRRFIKSRGRQLELEIGARVALALPRGVYRVAAFKGSYRVPVELLRAYLAHRETVDGMKVGARHAYLLPFALAAIGVQGETVDKHVWYAPLADYQIEPMHETLSQAGYFPSNTDNTLTKMRKLIMAGKPDAEDATGYSFGAGIHKVTFGPARTVHYRGTCRTIINESDGRMRVKVDGKRVALRSWLSESVSTDDWPKVVEIARRAAWDEAGREAAATFQQAQEAAKEAQLDAMDLFDAEQPAHAGEALESGADGSGRVD